MATSGFSKNKHILPEPRWYAIYTRSRCEKKVAFLLDKLGIKHFLPLLPTSRRWKDRHKVVSFPLFPSYLFVYSDLKDKIEIVSTEGVVRLVGFNGKPSSIPDVQIENLRQLLIKPEFVKPSVYISTGKKVEILHGPFAGIQGRLLQYNGRRRVVVGIDSIQQSISVEVEKSWIKPIEMTNS